MTQFPLASDTFGEEEREAVMSVLDSGRYSMGERVRKFEQEFANWVGFKDGVMVNSGSSANLLLIASLLYRSNGRPALKPGDEVLVPALSWSTTVWPVAQLGLVPVVVDIDPDTLAVDPKSIEKAIGPKTKALFMIHVLGQAAPMDEILDVCQRKGLLLIEDCCETLGAYWSGKHVGKFGYGGSFSHFFSHHLTTIEGGSILSDDLELIEDLRSLRAHGWTRERGDKAEIQKRFPDLDARFLFLLPGFNVRPTEIQGALGLVQLKKLNEMLEKRVKLAEQVYELKSKVDWLKMIGSNQLAIKGTHRSHSWMNIPFFVTKEAPLSREKVQEILEENGVETRPIIAGNILRHPGMGHIPFRSVETPVADSMVSNGFMIGCHPNMTVDELEVLAKAFSQLGER